MAGVVPQLSSQAALDRKLSQRSLYYLCKEVLGYKDMVPHVHGDLCDFATNPAFGRYRQATVPRSWFKTWVLTIGKSIWLSLPDEESLYKSVYPYKGANARILIASNVIENAMKMVNKIKTEWENNPRLRAAFPELVPNINRTRWSDSCAQLNRPGNYTEGTYTAVGSGGSVISQHFDHIIEDDLVYAKKDDFTGQELMPSQEDIDNAIGWHKLAFSLLANPKEGCIDNVGTRWAPHDLIDYIRTRELQYKGFEIAVTRQALWPVPDNAYCIWPERYDLSTLESIRATQGAKIFETQYLNRPRAGEDVTFSLEYLNRHDTLAEYPEDMKYLTIVDLASWGDAKRLARNVILTGAKTPNNNFWIARVDAGRFNPSQVIDLFKAHSTQFNSKVMIEEIQYQRAIRHFAKLDMQKPGTAAYTIEALPYDGRKNAKELRIQSVEPIVINGMLHVLSSMKDLLQEMEDYPYSSTKDILDCLGYFVRYARPAGVISSAPRVDPFSIESIEQELKARQMASQYPIADPLVKELTAWR